MDKKLFEIGHLHAKNAILRPQILILGILAAVITLCQSVATLSSSLCHRAVLFLRAENAILRADL